MKYSIIPFINYVVISSLFYIILLLVFGIERYNLSSIVGQLIALGVLRIFAWEDLQTFSAQDMSKTKTSMKIQNLAVILVVANTLVGIFNLLFLNSKLLFNKSGGIDEQAIFIYSGIIGIILAQTVGWIFQGFVVKLFATFIGAEGTLTLYLNLTGYSYVGFLVLSCYTFVYNVFVITHNIPVNDFNVEMASSWAHIVPSKIAEIIVIAVLAYGIFFFEKIRIWTCLIIASVPSLLLGISFLIFKLFAL